VNTWRSLLADGVEVVQVSDHIWSVLPGAPRIFTYDRRARLYDAIVGSRLYNRVMWGARIDGLREFAARAVESRAGPILDAACGSMLFSSEAHRSTRLTVACDLSIAMLERALDRLERRGAYPENVVLLQADVMRLPFRPGVFSTVLCMNVLHHIENGDGLARGLSAVLAPGGRLCLTSLVANDRLIGGMYLDVLHNRGEFAEPREPADIERIFREVTGPSQETRLDGNMMYLATG
jgi:SAM-dependent methyltransferase